MCAMFAAFSNEKLVIILEINFHNMKLSVLQNR